MHWEKLFHDISVFFKHITFCEISLSGVAGIFFTLLSAPKNVPYGPTFEGSPLSEGEPLQAAVCFGQAEENTVCILSSSTEKQRGRRQLRVTLILYTHWHLHLSLQDWVEQRRCDSYLIKRKRKRRRTIEQKKCTAITLVNIWKIWGYISPLLCLCSATRRTSALTWWSQTRRTLTKYADACSKSFCLSVCFEARMDPYLRQGGCGYVHVTPCCHRQQWRNVWPAPISLGTVSRGWAPSSSRILPPRGLVCQMAARERREGLLWAREGVSSNSKHINCPRCADDGHNRVVKINSSQKSEVFSF